MKIKTILCKCLAIFLFLIPVIITIFFMLGIYNSENIESIKIINMISMGLIGVLFSMIYMQYTKEAILNIWEEE